MSLRESVSTLLFALLLGGVCPAHEIPTTIAFGKDINAPDPTPRVLVNFQPVLVAPASDDAVKAAPAGRHTSFGTGQRFGPLGDTDKAVLSFQISGADSGRTWWRLEARVSTPAREGGRELLAGADLWGRLNGADLGRSVAMRDGLLVLAIPGGVTRPGENSLTLWTPSGRPFEVSDLRVVEVKEPLEATHLPRAAMAMQCTGCARGAAPAFASGPPTGSSSDYDALDYAIDWTFPTTPTTARIIGDVTIRGASTVDGLQSVRLDFSDTLTISAITDVASAAPLTFTRANPNILNVTLPAPLNPGQEFRIRVQYNGDPNSTNLLGASYTATTRNGQPWISTLSQPYGARDWWPCKDRPDDKATVSSLRITVPSALHAYSNGVLTATSDNGNGTKTFNYMHGYPISSYLVCVVVAQLQLVSQTYTSRDGLRTMPLEYWVFSDQAALAQVDWGRTPQMMEHFASLFGEYPFVDERYAMSMFTFSGGMEHQTSTSMGTALLTGNRQYESISAHELGHQWFGDKVTCATWDNIWLNEGFASYTEALWREKIAPPNGLRSFMQGYAAQTYNTYTVLNPGESNMFGNTVYRKGMWILHMLRRVMGDERFFAGMRAYLSRHAYGAVVTSDFQAVMEQHAGQDLDWFFNQWLTQIGRPTISVGTSSYRSEEGTLLLTGIARITPATYRMPVDMQAGLIDDSTGATQNIKVQVWMEGSQPNAPFATALGTFGPTWRIQSVSVDPDLWLLKSSASISPLPILNHTGDAPLATINSAYRFPLYASGGTAPYTWSLASSSGPLPDGLTLTGAAITGTPTGSPGSYPITLEVRDSAGSAMVSVSRTIPVQLNPSSVGSFEAYH